MTVLKKNIVHPIVANIPFLERRSI